MIGLRSKITKAVLGYFMLHAQVEAYTNELARRLDLDSGNLSRKLNELEKQGLLKSREMGKTRYYSLNPSYPLLREYKQIILKTVGIEKTLKDELQYFPGLEQAYLFGSYAKDRMDAASDIDLLVVGTHSTVELSKKIAQIQKTIDREINLISMSREEYERRKKNDPFVRSLEKSTKIKIV